MPRERQPCSTRAEDDDDRVFVRFTDGQFALTHENAGAFGELLHGAAEQAVGRQLVLDFSNVVFVSAAGLGALVRLHRKLRATGGSLALCDLDDLVYEVFEVTALTTLFEVRR
jgi:anti-anti-sigma factor